MAPHTFEAVGNQRGFWGQTATIDWCEPNYVVSYLIAEFWNTLSNLSFILPQIATFMKLLKYRSVEPVYSYAFLTIAIVGISSAGFHMTLAKSMQMFDETSMIVLSLQGFYLLYIIKDPSVNRKALAAFLVCYGTVFLSFYVFLVAWPIFHNIAFLLLVYISAAIAYQVSSPKTFWTVIILQHTAGIFWLIDKHFCEVLTSFREYYVPSVLGPVFQFHALWHLLMGLSSQIFVCQLITVRAWTQRKEVIVMRHKWLGLYTTLEKVEDFNGKDTKKLT